jgi:Tol biopolymer transport system component
MVGFAKLLVEASLMAALLLGMVIAASTPPSWASSPVYGKIAFSRHESGGFMGDWDIWIMNTDGSGQTKLLDSTYKDSDPHFKYDGTKIVFGRYISGTPPSEDIYVMNSDGTGVTNLTGDFSSDASEPKFSWDGTKIVFTVSVGMDNHDIYVMNADGSGKTAIVTGSNNDVWPSYSPDAQYIVFQRYVGPVSDMKSKICRYSISSGVTIDLTGGTDLDEMPVYSPDGAYVIFKRGGGAGTNMEIYRLHLATSTLTNLTGRTANDDAPMYSYEGDKIAWHSDTGGGIGIESNEIWTMNSDGTGKISLTSNSVADFNPTFSPATTSIPRSVSEIDANVVKASTYSVYYIIGDYHGSKLSGVGYASPIDWTASGYVVGLSTYTQNEGSDAGGILVSTSTGQPRTDVIGSGKSIVLFGGPGVNAAVYWYEHGYGADKAPVYYEYDSAAQTCYFKLSTTGAVLGQTTISELNTMKKDVFLIEVLQDGNGRFVAIFYGFGGMGSYAAGKYFKFTVYPSIGTYTKQYYVVR